MNRVRGLGFGLLGLEALNPTDGTLLPLSALSKRNAPRAVLALVSRPIAAQGVKVSLPYLKLSLNTTLNPIIPRPPTLRPLRIFTTPFAAPLLYLNPQVGYNKLPRTPENSPKDRHSTYVRGSGNSSPGNSLGRPHFFGRRSA